MKRKEQFPTGSTRLASAWGCAAPRAGEPIAGIFICTRRRSPNASAAATFISARSACTIGSAPFTRRMRSSEFWSGARSGRSIRKKCCPSSMSCTPENFPEAEAREKVEAIPQASTERIRSLAELLAAAAARISPAFAGSLGDRQRVLDQQSRIASAIHDIKANEEGGEPIPPYPIAKERELLDAIRRNDESTARRVLNELLGAIFFTSGHRFDIIKFRGLELMVLLSRAAAESGASVEEVLGLNYRFLKRFQELETQEDLAFCLDSVLSRFSRLAFSFRAVKHASAIEKALRFIKRPPHLRCFPPRSRRSGWSFSNIFLPNFQRRDGRKFFRVFESAAGGESGLAPDRGVNSPGRISPRRSALKTRVISPKYSNGSRVYRPDVTATPAAPLRGG